MNAETTLKIIEAHPLTRQLRAEEAAQTLVARQQAAARLAGLKQEAAETLPELERAAAVLKAELDTIDRQRLEILDRQRTAAARLLTERQRYERDQAAAESELIETADPRIDEAIAFFRERFDGLRTQAIHHDTRQGKRNLFTMKRALQHFSNYPATAGALAYCRDAITELGQMRLHAEPDHARIESLVNAVPDASVMSEYAADKPIDPGPLGFGKHSIPLDSEYDLQMKRIDEEHRRIMAR